MKYDYVKKYYGKKIREYNSFKELYNNVIENESKHPKFNQFNPGFVVLPIVKNSKRVAMIYDSKSLCLEKIFEIDKKGDLTEISFDNYFGVLRNNLIPFNFREAWKNNHPSANSQIRAILENISNDPNMNYIFVEAIVYKDDYSEFDFSDYDASKTKFKAIGVFSIDQSEHLVFEEGRGIMERIIFFDTPIMFTHENNVIFTSSYRWDMNDVNMMRDDKGRRFLDLTKSELGLFINSDSNLFNSQIIGLEILTPLGVAIGSEELINTDNDNSKDFWKDKGLIFFN